MGKGGGNYTLKSRRERVVCLPYTYIGQSSMLKSEYFSILKAHTKKPFNSPQTTGLPADWVGGELYRSAALNRIAARAALRRSENN